MTVWMTMAVLVIAGLVLIAVDFYLPGFVLGSIGVVMMLGAIGLCYQAYGLSAAILAFLAEGILGGAVAYGSIRYFPSTATGRKMILSHTQVGARSQDERGTHLIGTAGIAQTNLRPTGMATLNGQRMEVIAESGLIERGSPVQVVAVKDNRVVVRKTT